MPSLADSRASRRRRLVLASPLLAVTGTALGDAGGRHTATTAGAVAPPEAASGTERSRRRAAPPRLQPVVHEGVRYEELRGGKGRGLPQNGGYVVALDHASGTELWIAKIYDIVYDGVVEDDRREVYIVRMRLDRSGRQLLIVNERDERFALRLNDRMVSRLRP